MERSVRSQFVHGTAVVVLWCLCESAQAAVSIAYVPVGNPGNPADPASNGKLGAVSTAYAIGKYEVTNAEYAEFLNTVDAGGANPRALYNANMSTNALGGITLVAGNASGSKYVVKAGHTSKPVVYVSWFDAARMANWLSNGQGGGSTEAGAYTLTGNATMTGGRSASAKVFIPSENEWYKAAYYQPATAGGDTDNYWLYPTRTNVEPTADAPAGNANSANYEGMNGFAVTQSKAFSTTQDYLTDVGAYTAAKSYYGTFDQAGNVDEWVERIDGDDRYFRGRGWTFDANSLPATRFGGASAIFEGAVNGFRLAAVPEPSTLAALALFGRALQRRRRII